MWIMIAVMLFLVLFLLVAMYSCIVTLSPEDKMIEDAEQEAWFREYQRKKKSSRK